MIIGKRKIRSEMRKRKNHDSTLLRWQNGNRYRNSHIAVGWTEEYCRYLDSISSGDISCIATWSERSGYKNNLTLGVNVGAKPGTTKLRPDYPGAVRTLAAIKHQEGRTSPYIPKHQRERQRPIEDRERLESEWGSWNWNVNNTWSPSSSSSSTTWGQQQCWHEPPEQQEWQGQQKWLGWRD